MKQPPTDEQESQSRPREHAGIFKASSLLLQCERQNKEQICCPHCGHRFKKPPDKPGLSRPVQLPVQATEFLFQPSFPRSSPHVLDPFFRQTSTPARLRDKKPDYLATILGSLIAGYTDRFFAALLRWPELLQDQLIWECTIGLWSKQKLDPDKKIRRKACENLRRAGEALAYVKQGNWKLSKEEQRAIIAAYKKWYPICKGLNKEFKETEWKEKKLEVSELRRKEEREQLAEKYHIATTEVEAIEWLLEQPSGRRGKSTPTQATCHMVAREFPMIGKKTVETIWGEYKTSTTPVAERTT